MIDRHPWILAAAGTLVLGVVLFGVAFGAPPVVDDLNRALLKPRPISFAGVLAVAYLFHRSASGIEDALARRRTRRRARALLERHDRRNA